MARRANEINLVPHAGHVTTYQRTLANTADVMQRELEKLENLVEDLKDTGCSWSPERGAVSSPTCSLSGSS